MTGLKPKSGLKPKMGLRPMTPEKGYAAAPTDLPPCGGDARQGRGGYPRPMPAQISANRGHAS
ncbi:hypothetical protein SAMN05880582_1011493 [Rhizobium sp. RU20A]|nr:hypothetical protein SAMN05880582_1011493 [Rhizobium sp. RU20A]